MRRPLTLISLRLGGASQYICDLFNPWERTWADMLTIFIRKALQARVPSCLPSRGLYRAEDLASGSEPQCPNHIQTSPSAKTSPSILSHIKVLQPHILPSAPSPVAPIRHPMISTNISLGKSPSSLSKSQTPKYHTQRATNKRLNPRFSVLAYAVPNALTRKLPLASKTLSTASTKWFCNTGIWSLAASSHNSQWDLSSFEAREWLEPSYSQSSSVWRS